VDGDKCDEWQDAELLALMDHELTHVKLVIDEQGALVRDDVNRPKLKLRKHDWQNGGFYSVAKKHKDMARDVQAIVVVAKEFIVQGVLAGF
jgi:Putative phage metallopeptidase